MEDNPMDKHQKKQLRRYIAWGCAGALVVLLAVMPMLAAAGDDDTPQASILSGQAARQTQRGKLQLRIDAAQCRPAYCRLRRQCCKGGKRPVYSQTKGLQ